MSERRRWWALLVLFAAGIAVTLWAWDAGRDEAPDEADAEDVGSTTTAAPSETRGASAEQASSPDAGAFDPRAQAVRLSPAVVRADPSSPGGVLSGRVVGWSSGRPVPGAELTFARSESVQSVRCDEEGRFAFAPEEPGSYALALVTAQGYLPFAPEWGQSPIRFEARAGVRVENVTVTLVDAVQYTVRVERDDAPVAGATVRVFGLDRGERALAPMVDRYTTGEDGEVAIRAPDYAVLEAHHDAHGRGRAAIDSAAQVSRRVTVTLRDAPADQGADAALVGRVVDRGGAGVAGARVVADRGSVQGGSLHPTLEGQTDDEGAFRLDGADEGTYRLVVTADGFARARADEVATGTPTTITLEPGGAVRVVVRDADSGDPLAAWTVIVEQPRGAVEWDTLASVSGYGDDAVEVRGLPRGPCRVLAISPGYAPSDPVSAQASAAPSTTEIRLTRGGTLRGRVVSADGSPLEGARATVEDRLGAGASAVPVASSALTDEDGRFELTGVRRGLLSVVTWAADHHGRVRSGVVVGDDPVDLGTIDLSVVEEGEEPGIELAGIGAVLSAEGDVLRIGQVVEGGGAIAAGLAAGDSILEIDGAPVGDLGFGGSIERIRGPEGTIVRLTVLRAGSEEPETIAVPRRRIRA